MNLTKLFEMQKALDERIDVEHPTQPGEDRLAKKILALQVELGELANEWRGFKFWSKDQEPRTNYCPPGQWEGYGYRNLVLEEYVDCLHFILSIGLELGLTKLQQENLHEELRGTMEAFQHSFNWAVHLEFVRHHSADATRTCFTRLVDVFIALGYFLGFTWEQIEAAYLAKNKVNHSRQETGY